MNAKTLFTFFMLLAFFAAGCKKPTAAMPPDVDHYTCTMHPSVVSYDPHGKCPICGMELVPVKKKTAGAVTPARDERAGHQHGALAPAETKTAETAGQPNTFLVPVDRQQQIGVTFARVERRKLQHSIRASGVVAVDKMRRWEFVARTDGYVAKLFTAYAGEIVEKDQPLLSIYSPDLLSTERELIALLAARDKASGEHSARETFDKLIDSAERRLRQWNLTDAQIADLKKSSTATDTLTLLSPFRGVVEEVPVHQGRNVKTGDRLLAIADLSVVSVWAEFYENAIAMLEVGQKISVTSEAVPGVAFEAHVGLIDPFIDENKRTVKVRFDVLNPRFELRPGMFVNAELSMDMGEGLAIPVGAVMPTGARNFVFVNHGGGQLEPRLVQLGAKIGGHFEVKSGLKEKEQIVASANFLIDAEANVQNALKDFGDHAAPKNKIEVKP